jgi:hypothetical protein
VLLFVPELRAWVFQGPGWYLVFIGLIGAMAWTIWMSE